jgi:hypothetical protein
MASGISRGLPLEQRKNAALKESSSKTRASELIRTPALIMVSHASWQALAAWEDEQAEEAREEARKATAANVLRELLHATDQERHIELLERVRQALGNDAEATEHPIPRQHPSNWPCPDVPFGALL